MLLTRYICLTPMSSEAWNFYRLVSFGLKRRSILQEIGILCRVRLNNLFEQRFEFSHIKPNIHVSHEFSQTEIMGSVAQKDVNFRMAISLNLNRFLLGISSGDFLTNNILKSFCAGNLLQTQVRSQTKDQNDFLKHVKLLQDLYIKIIFWIIFIM